MSRRLSVWMLCTLSLFWSSLAEAVDRQWIQTSGTQSFNDANNWDPTGVPLADDDLVFSLDGDVDVVLGAPSVANDVTFTDGMVEFHSVDGMLLNGGTIKIDDVTAASLADGAHVTLNGGEWISTRGADLGVEGRASLNVIGGGVLQVDELNLAKETTGEAHVTVSGSANATPSTLRVVGRSDFGDSDNLAGNAVLDIVDGGLVTIGGPFFFGSHGTGTINVSGVGSMLQTSGSYFLGDGRDGTGTMNLTGGATATSADVQIGDDFRIFDNSGSTGVANIDGAGTSWSITGALFVGEFGSGAINVTGGGLVSSSGGDVGLEANSTGTVDVSGSGSFWNAVANGTNAVRVGNLGDGALQVHSGGRVDAHELLVGDGADSVGAASVTIDGSGSTVNVAEIASIGLSHAGNLTVSGGGVLNTSTSGDFDFFIDRNQTSAGGSAVNVDGAGSQLNHQGTGSLVVGVSLVSDFAQAAQLNVTGGGQVTTDDLDVSFFGPSRGMVTVDGAGSRIDAANNIEIGSQGEGQLHIEDGGVVAAQGRIDISRFRTDATATVTGVGSQLTAGTVLGVAAFHPAAFNGFATGTLTIADGATVSNTGNGLIAGASRNVATVHVGDGGARATWNNGASLIVGGGNGNGSATLNVNAGGVVNVVDTLDVKLDATVNLDGGVITTDTLDVADPTDFNFNAGTLRLTGDETLDGAAYAQYFGGVGNPSLGANQHLAVTGAATLAAPITLNHSTASLSIGSTSDVSNVDWNAGALNFTNQNLVIGAAGLLGGLVTVNDEQALGVPNNELEIQSLANLNVTSGGLRVGSAINDGRIFISGVAAIDFDADNMGAGLTNNEDLVIVDSSVGGDIINHGAFDVAGDIELAGNLALGAAGTIDFLVGGALPGEFGSIAVGGDVDLGGDFDVSLTGGFSPTAGDLFEILRVDGTLSGRFEGLPDGALVGNFGGVDLLIDYDAGDGNDVALFAPSASDADIDDDNDVDGRDFLSIQRSDSALIAEWQASFGIGTGAAADPVFAAAASVVGVPEPASLLLLAVGLSALIYAARGRE